MFNILAISLMSIATEWGPLPDDIPSVTPNLGTISISRHFTNTGKPQANQKNKCPHTQISIYIDCTQ